MPVYEYRCAKGHTYEKTESFSASAIQKCITCGARAKRQISMPAVIFKGSGFYSTDNRGAGPSGGRSAASDDGDTPATTPAADNGHGHSHDDTPKVETPVD